MAPGSGFLQLPLNPLNTMTRMCLVYNYGVDLFIVHFGCPTLGIIEVLCRAEIRKFGRRLCHTPRFIRSVQNKALLR